MKYTCSPCNYETSDKSNLNKHLNSVAHAKKGNHIQNVDKKLTKNVNKKLPSIFRCPTCSKYYSSISSLSRHKNKYCKTNIITEQVKIKLEYEFSERLRQKELEMELDYTKKLLVKSEQLQTKSDGEIKELKCYIKNTKSATFNISVKKLVQQTYPDAPYLAMLKNYATIHGDEDVDFTQDLIYYYNKNKLDDYLGDIIIKYYKKKDPKDQSLWSTDSTRLKYIIKELLASNKSSWNEDDKGIKINKYIMEPLLESIHEYINEQIDKLHERILNATADECIKISQNQLDLSHIREQIKNGQLKGAINRYICPSFKFNSDKLIEIQQKNI